MADKLSIATPISVRVTVAGRKRAYAMAEANGMEVGEYIRHLLAQDEVKQHQKWAALNPVFSTSSEASTNGASDSVCEPFLTTSEWGGL